MRDARARSALRNNFLKEFSHTHRLQACLGQPQIFELETTNACPYTCVMCPRTHAMSRPIGHMDFDLFRAIIDQVRPEWQMDGIHSKPTMRLLHYGEPFVYPHYAEAIRYCHARGFCVYISTNPSVWTDRRIEETLDTGVDELFVMVDGMDDETSMAIRGKAASFVRGENNIRELARRKVQRGSLRPHLTVAMIKQPRNAHQWDLFRNYWNGIEGIDAVYLAHYSTFDGGVEQINALAEDLALRDDVQQRQLRHQEVLTQYPCYYPWHSVSVTWEGEVVPCCRDYDASLVLGDLRRQSLGEIWNGTRLQQLRRDFGAAKLTSTLCSTCKESSLEIGLPGRTYFPAAWMRRLGLGKMRGRRHDSQTNHSLAGAQNIHRLPLIPSEKLVESASSLRSRKLEDQLVGAGERELRTP